MVERILWSMYDHAEAYTFLLVWVVVPLSFFTIFLYIRRASIPILNVEPTVVLSQSAFAQETETPTVESSPKDSKRNLNEANA